MTSRIGDMDPHIRKLPCDQCHARRVRCRNTASGICQSCSSSDLPCTRKLVRKKRGPKPAKRALSPARLFHEDIVEPTIGPTASASITRQRTISSDSNTTFTEFNTALVNRLHPSRLQIQSLQNADHSVTVNELANLVFQYTEGDNTDANFVWPSGSAHGTSHANTSPLIQINSPSTPGFSATWPRTTQWIGTETAHSRDIHLSEEPTTALFNSITTSAQPDATLLAITLGLPLHFGAVILECVEIHFCKIHHVLPLLQRDFFINLLMRPSELTISQRSFVLAFCAATKLRYACRSGETIEPLSRELGCRFLEQCLRLRSDIDYMENLNPMMVTEAWFLHLSYACLSKPKSARQFLREGICLTMELGLHGKVPDQKSVEAVCVARTITLLYVTERATVVLGDFASLLFRAPPVLPTMVFDEADRHMLYGFQCLYGLFSLLDIELLDYWFSGSLADERHKESIRTKLAANQAYLGSVPFEEQRLDDIQRADILVTQHWMRHLFWQISMRAGLLSSRSDMPAFLYSFPFKLSRDLCSALRSVPAEALDAHHFSIVSTTPSPPKTW